jgi:hypothetical protein
MKNTYIIALIVVSALLIPISSPAEVDWAVDILPGALLANFSADEFHVIHDNQKEEVSMLSSIPSIAAGFAIERVSGYIDVKAGTGMVLNGKFSSFMFFGTAGIYKEIRPSIMMGPHITLTRFSAPSWWGDADIEFEDTIGYLLGMHLIAGDRISYLLSVDYLSAVFDVDPTSPVKANKEELDISGIAVQFGVRAQF